MSGIAAIYDASGSPVSTLDVVTLLEAIAHRGPDETVWAGDCAALAQRTLPTTLEAAREELPISVAGGKYQLALDGRLDNREEIISALGIAGGGPTLTDAELIAVAYERWGENSVKRLIGDFAFVLWDRRQYRLLVARDQRGFRPLVYARVGSQIVFGSEPHQLLEVEGLSHEEDQMFLACHLSGGTPPQGHTPYQAVREIPPAHYMVVEDGKIRVQEYWRFEPRPHLRYSRQEEYVEHFEETFAKAASAAARSPSPPAVLLSGGLDSSYVLARVQETRPDVGAYTAFVEGMPTMDERAHSKAVSERLGVPTQYVAADDCWSLSSAYVADSAIDQPDLPMQAPLMVRMAQAARQDGRSVLIDGMGGDEFFIGPHHYLADMILAGRGQQMACEALGWSRDGHVPLTRVLRHEALVPLLPGTVRTLFRRLRDGALSDSLPPWLDGSVLKALGLSRSIQPKPPIPAWRRGEAVRAFWDFHTAATLSMMAWRERQALAPHGVEVRSPLWDLRVVEMVLRTPSWVHWNNGRPKALLRRAMQPRLPNTVVSRDDKGTFDDLMNIGLLEQERERVDRALIDGPLTQLPYIRGSVLKMELERYRSLQHRWWPALWRAITAGLWLHINKVSRGHKVDRLATTA